MSLKFYYGQGSPFTWRIRLALEAKGVPFEIVPVSMGNGEHKTDAYAQINPRMQIPAIVDGDLNLYESAVVLEYIQEKHPEQGLNLFPGGVELRAKVRRLVAEVDQYVWQATLRMVENVFYKSGAPEAWNHTDIERGKKDLAAEYARFEAYFDGDWIAGTEQPTAADFTLYPFLMIHERLDSKYEPLHLTQDVPPKLKAFKARIAHLPYYESTYPSHWPRPLLPNPR